MKPIALKTLVIAGIEIDVFSQANETPLLEPVLPVLVLFVIPHRTAKRVHYYPFAKHAFEVASKRQAEGDKPARELVVVVLVRLGYAVPESFSLYQDLRNHGTRRIERQRNGSWDVNPEVHNPTFAIDAYAIQHGQCGTAMDVSFLIDYLGMYLYPYGRRRIDRWAVTGHSIGALSVWQCLKNDPRITIGIPISGWTNCLSNLEERATIHHVPLPLAPPHVPQAFIDHLGQMDMITPGPFINWSSPTNPLARKKVLLLIGEEDEWVQRAYDGFLDRVRMDTLGGGVKRVELIEGVGHWVSEEMIQKMADFIWEVGLSESGQVTGVHEKARL